MSSARLKLVRIAPRKMNLIAREVRDLSVDEAIAYLRMSPRRRVAEVFERVIGSAVANHLQTSEDKSTHSLKISKMLVGQGPIMKRFMPRAKGSASSIMKRTSNLLVEVESR